MNASRRAAICAMFVGAVLLTACGKSEPPPPPPKAEPPKPVAPTVNAELKRLAAEVYVFAFPLVLSDVTRAVETAGLPPDTFRHTRTLPDAKTATPNPNADFLYSQAWLDLSNGPVILSVPDTKGRYYLIATPRCVDQRRRLPRQAHDRHREGRIRDRRTDVEGHAAGRRLRSHARRRT